MSRAVYKFPLAPSLRQVVGRGVTLLQMPKDAQILSVQMQRDNPVLWALVDEAAPKVLRGFVALLTGQSYDLPVDAIFVQTLQFGEGSYIVHLFDIGERGEVPQ